VTPFVDNGEPIDVAKLPNQGIGTGCPEAGGTVPPGTTGLCQRIYTLMYDLLADAPTVSTLVQARRTAGLGDAAPRRVKVACGFAYPVRSASGVTSANPISPLVPVALARSFVIDGTRTDQIGDFSSVFATAAAGWAQGAGVALGPSALAGAQFVFDITLYAELSGLNTPVLRLRNLQLNLTDVAIS
jgi:large repetitive protein